jgi:hypothetical protein
LRVGNPSISLLHSRLNSLRSSARNEEAIATLSSLFSFDSSFFAALLSSL